MKLLAWAPIACAILASTASAEGLYITGALSRSQDSLDRSYFDSALTAAGAAGLTSSSTGSGTQWRMQGGYRISPNFAVEAGYIDFGKARYRASYAAGTADGTLKAGGVDAAALLLLPLDNKFTVFGKAGVVAATVKASYPAATLAALPVSNSSVNVVRPLLGLGALYKLNDKVDLRAEFDHVSRLGSSAKTGTMNANMYAIGVAYNF